MSRIHFFNLERYYKKGSGSNCPAQHIITDEHYCMISTLANSLGYIFEALEDRHYPAGCFWDSDGGWGKARFNKIIDPSETMPETFGNRGGICMNRSK